ncbi:MAG: hypothetical protein NTY17_08120 [Planctomycetia bacterium]|nr:hypothetical protein [Planctomycetia bacterium]
MPSLPYSRGRLPSPCICISAALLMVWAAVLPAAETTLEISFTPEQLQARNVERSGVVAGQQGPVFETVVDAAGEKTEGTMASAQTAPLSPGLYEAAITFDAELFPDYPTLPFAMPSWLSIGGTRAAGGQPPVNRPVWLHDIATSTQPLTRVVPFEVTGAPSAYRISLDWRTHHRVPGLGKAAARVHGITVRRIDTGCFIRSVLTDKVITAPGGSAIAVCEIVNVGEQPWQGTLDLTLLSGIEDRRSVGTVEVVVPAGEATTLRQEFDVGLQLFGRGLVATLADASGPIHTRDTAFAVADHFWDVALGTTGGGIVANSGMYGDRGPALVKEQVAHMRARYSNWFEKTFWAPDDWGNLMPTEPEWASGQAARQEHAGYLKQHISAARDQGIRVISYGKGMAGGPSAYELLRKKPEFFVRNERTGRWGANADLWDLDHWSDFTVRAKEPKKFTTSWHRIPPDLARLDALDHGIDQLIASARRFGFDGVRFDGHFSAVDDVVSTFNMRRLKERVWREHPDYLFGFNFCAPLDYADPFPHEVREGLAGGGMWMNEAVGQWSRKGSGNFTSWRDYATQELASSRRIQAAGGTYHLIHRLPAERTEQQRYYKFVISVLAGAHPCYGDHEFAPGATNWGRFLTRFGGLFWHPRRAAVDPAVVGFEAIGLPADVAWQTWPQTVPVAADREWLVVPFLRYPATDEIAKTDAYPAPATGGRLAVKATALRSRVKQAWWIEPDAEPVPLKMDGDGTLALPPIAPFGVVVLELEGCPGFAPVARPRFTEPVSDAAVAKSRAGGGRIVVVDPLRPELNAAADDRVQTVESEQVSWSAKMIAFDDAKASGGKAAGGDRTLGTSVCAAYFPNLPPGSYRVTLRARTTHPFPDGGMVTIYEQFRLPDGKLLPREGSKLGQPLRPGDLDREYREIVVKQPYEHFGLGFGTVFVHFPVPVDAPPDARFLLDWVRIERLEDYTDAVIAKKMQIRTADVAAGPRQQVLWLRGLYDDLYALDKAIESGLPGAMVTRRYQRELPQAAADLAPFGTIILTNVPVDQMGVVMRKAYADWTRAGGHLVVLGGDYALGQGLMKGTFLEAVLPCGLTVNADVARLPEGSGIDGLGRVFFAHAVKPESDATVLASAGEMSMLLTRPIGKGRCTVFAGTVLGGDGDDAAAFWNAAGWPALLGRAIAGE